MKVTTPLAPIYCIHGEEILLIQDTVKTIRQAAQQTGFNERKKFSLEPGFDWENFLCEANSLSLFSEKTLLELQFDETKLSESARQALEIYCKKPPQDKILLITFNKLDGKEKNTKWFKYLETCGVVINVYPLIGAKLNQWIMAQLQQAGFNTTHEGVQMLAELTEGHLLATRQAIDKLHLYYQGGTLSAAEIATIITDSAHYDIFDFTDALLAGNIKRSYHIYQHIMAEGIELTLLLWAILRELRLLIQISQIQTQGQSLEQSFAKLHVWENKKNYYRQALQRHTLQSLYLLLQEAGEIDQLIKGAVKANVENSMLQFSLKIAGLK